MANNIQQLYKTQQQDKQHKIPNDINVDDKEDLSSVTPDICINGKIRCNNNEDKGIMHNDINHSGGNCDVFNAGAVNMEHNVGTQKLFTNDIGNVIGTTDPMTIHTNMFEQDGNIFGTVVSTNILHMLFGEKQMKKSTSVCNFDVETNFVDSMSPLSY
jgi:hypothetical protein